MKSKIFFFAAIALAMVACEPNEPESKTKDLDIIYKGQSPYIDLYNNGGMEQFILTSSLNLPNETNASKRNGVNRTEDVTITLKNDMKIRLHDDYVLKEEGTNTILQLTRTGTILGEPVNGIDSEEETFSVTQTYDIQSVQPIELYSPVVDKYDPIPECSYDNFTLRWNAEQMNTNGIAVIAEWTGNTIFDSPQDAYIVNIDIVPDTGEAVLNPELFKNMPDEALVNIWLFRCDYKEIDGTEGSSVLFKDEQQKSQDAFKQLLSNNSDLLLQMRPFIFGSSALTGFSCFLRRE